VRIGRKINSVVSEGKAQKSRHRIWLIALIVAVFVVWSAFAPLDEIVRGIGKVVPTMKNQVIQNLEGGIVTELFVTEGDVVEAGQLVVKMDETRFQSAYQELQDQSWALTLRLARLRAEGDLSNDFIPDEELLRLAPEHAESEIQLFQARRSELQATMRDLQDAIDLKTQELDILRPMAERFAVSQIDLIRAEQVAVDVRSRLSAIQNEFETARSQEYSEILGNLRRTAEQARSREDQLFRTDVRSPIRGIVNKVLATTIGGVAQPGDPLLEVISLEDNLRVEGRIDSRDIGHVYVGMPATIKLMAFDFSIYGTLEGRVIHVGADTVTDEQQREPRPYYEVFIQLEATVLEGPSGQVEIRPGMQAQIELASGQKTVLQYILKPLFKTTEALSER
jgi:adhesin transport system membrane fusion protein